MSGSVKRCPDMQSYLLKSPSGFVAIYLTTMTNLILRQCIQETQEKVVQFQKSQIIPALDHGVCKSDTIISSALKTTLRASIERLERGNKHDSTKWSEAVESLIVDPSLYPLCFGRTGYRGSAMSKIEDSIKLCGKARSSYPPQEEKSGSLRGHGYYAIDNAWSTRYQWLPCDVEFDEHTGRAR